MGKIFKNFIRSFDWPLLAACLAASAAGLILIISAVANPPEGVSPNRLIFIQAAATGVGFAAAVVISMIDYRIFLPFAKYLVAVGVAVLALTGIFAPETAGNNSWIDIGIMTVQPSEFIKLLFIVTLSAHLSRLGEDMNRPKNLFFLLLHAALYIGAVLIQKDMGMAAIYILIFIIMMVVAGLRLRYMFISAVPVVAAAPLIWNFVLKDRQRFRILTMFNPELDPLGYGYQVIRSKTAIGSGKFLGAGYMKGVLTQGNLLPAKQTDFIFAVCGEEFGFLGCFCVISLLAFIVARIFTDAKRSTDLFGKYILTGTAAMLLSQIFINIGMCLGLTPVIGITLPFFSAGGSSMLSVWLTVGLVMSVVRHRRKSWQDVQ